MAHRHDERGHGHTHDAHEREVIVTERRGGGVGALIATVIGLLLLALIGWFLWNAFIAADDGGVLPENVEVNIDGGGGE